MSSLVLDTIAARAGDRYWERRMPSAVNPVLRRRVAQQDAEIARLKAEADALRNNNRLLAKMNSDVLAEMRQMQAERHDPATAEAACGDLRPGVLGTDLRLVLTAVSLETMIAVSDIRGPSRHAPFKRARHLFFWIGCAVCGHRPTDVARFLGKDHTTVLHAVKRIRDRLDREGPAINRIVGLIAPASLVHPGEDEGDRS